MVLEIAENLKKPADLISKHLALLRKAGLVTAGRNRLYQISPHVVADKSSRTIELGHCLLRLNNVG